ncbi:SARP family transcriptional regulator [Nonomuraea mesophila]|uniref:SARP family transcriptional regulator n=1 Tax=Nonomuraea mesophila TaxID=2530382 RepID=A0A4R5FTN3_9ACTN|nr:AfsR/SARP family transcriptional regulator [Nonomuraea mesophila]TDE56980.1 SARP family transcriptional regulator [Nonomuraea mesophila]
MLRIGVLGPLEAGDERGPIDLKGPRHRAVLARLLVARGRVVPVARLIDDLWESPGEGALGAVQTFVGALRKAIEPGRPPRTPARLLVTAAPGYALRAAPETVDAWRFEEALPTSARLMSAGEPGQAGRLLGDALMWWRGPAYAEFAELPWARGEAARLEELRLLAVERRAEAALASGPAALAAFAAEPVPDLEAHVASHPLREDGWRLLALALYRTGRQGDALATLRRARRVLRDELGVDPGPELRALESDILAQAPHLTPLRGPAVLISDRPTGVAGHPFVGRARELAELERAAATVAAVGQSGLALVSGEAGAGKTALARALTRRLSQAGWTVAWGASPEPPGAPAAWPWTQIRSRLPSRTEDTAPGGKDAVTDTPMVPVPEGVLVPTAAQPADEDDEAAGEDPVTARFRRQRVIGAHLAAVSANGPVLLVFDDLHWADEETLALVTAPATDLDVGPVLIVGTYRSTEISAGLAQTLGRAARAEPARIYLGGLTEPQVRELVRAVTRREPSAESTRTIHTRSGGNPFFVRELTRVWESDGDAALRSVPAGVRDVIRHRLAALSETARTHLRQAAVIGSEPGLDVLIGLAGDEERVLASVEEGMGAGFLVDGDADRLCFAHALVQESLYADVASPRRARWHASVAAIVERTSPGDVEAIAHHLLKAGGRAAPARTAHYARAAAMRSEHRFAPREAARLWRATIEALDRAGGAAPQRDGGARERLEAVMGMVRALAVTGDLREARRHRAEAAGAAEELGDPVPAAHVIGAFDVPAIWTTNDDEALSARLVAAAERTLAALSPGDDAERARLLITVAMERRADPGPRGDQAAREAEDIARRLGDPVLLACALNGRYLQTFQRAGLAPQRARFGEELVDLAARHDGLVTFEVLGHLILVQCSAALADLRAADRHAAAAGRLADRHDLPLVGVLTAWYAALRLAVTGREDEARTAYRAAATRLSGAGMPGMEAGLLPLALLCLDASTTMPSRVSAADHGPYESWARPLALLARGERDRAIAAARAVPGSPRDLLFEARSCLHALAAIETGDRPAMERVYSRLLPARGELAGAGTGLLTLGPVAQFLGRLAGALGRPDAAAQHYRQAGVLAARAGAPHWIAAARDALRGLGERPD